MDSLKRYNDWQNVLDYAHEEGYDEGYQEAVSKYEELLQQTIKRAEEEKRRAEENFKK